MKDIQNPAVQGQCQLQVTTINLIALHVGAYEGPDVYSLIIKKLKTSDLREFATSIRNAIYPCTPSHPHSKKASNGHLQSNVDELLQNSTSPFFSTLSSKGRPEQELEPINVLQDITSLLGLHVDDSIDISLQLIATCGIALSRIGRVITYNQGSSLVRHCWIVLQSFERFLHVNASPQSRRWSAISPFLEELTQQSNHNTCNIGTNDHVTSELSDRQILLKLLDRQDFLSHQMKQVLKRVVSLEGSVKSCQDTDRQDRDQDGVQQVSIFKLLAADCKEF